MRFTQNDAGSNRLFPFGLLCLTLLLSVCAAYAFQNGNAVQPSSVTPVAGGFRVDFPQPVAVSAVEYNGPFSGPVEVSPGSSAPKDIPQALKMIDSALGINPDSPTLLDSKGLILMQANRSQDAIPLMERAVELSCEGPIFVMHLASAHAQNGDPDTAMTLFDKVRPLLATRGDKMTKENKKMFDELEMKAGAGM